jgi:exopolysaccharide production protein ExoZ
MAIFGAYGLMGIQLAEITAAAGLATEPRVAGKKLVGVQTARGVAALLVVIYHTTRGLSLPQYLGHIPFSNAFGFGHSGVDFFFVLSGFIITYAHMADVGRSERVYRYLWRRIVRIYPIYWVVTGIGILHASFSLDVAARLAPLHLLYSFLLLPESAEPVVSVAWTLRSEMLFYLLFALAIVDRRFCRPLIIGTLLLISYSMIAPPTGPWTGLLVSPFNIEFLMGIATARWLVHRQIPGSAVLAAAGVIAFLVVGMMEVFGLVPLNGLPGRLLYGGASVAILAGIVELERSGRFRVGLIGVMMGDVSYALYLIHLAVVPLAIRSLADIGLLTVLPESITVVALVALALVVSVMLHVWVEVPLMMSIRRHTPRALR